MESFVIIDKGDSALILTMGERRGELDPRTACAKSMRFVSLNTSYPFPHSSRLDTQYFPFLTPRYSLLSTIFPPPTAAEQGEYRAL